MFVRKLKDCPKFISGDNCILREMLHRDKGDFSIRYSLAHAKLPKGKTTIPHRLKTSEVYYILKGNGIMHIDKESRKVKTGDTVYIPPRSTQYIKNTEKTALEFLCIVDPAWMKEDEEVLISKKEKQ